MSRINPATGLNERQERFCHAFVATGNAARAAADAGYSPRHARNHGHRLMARSAIRERISEIRTAIARDSIGDRGMLMAKIEEIYRRALDARDFGAALRVVQTQARMLGFDVPWKPSGRQRDRLYRPPYTSADAEAEARLYIKQWTDGIVDRRPPDRVAAMTTNDDISAGKFCRTCGPSRTCTDNCGSKPVQPGATRDERGPGVSEHGAA